MTMLYIAAFISACARGATVVLIQRLKATNSAAMKNTGRQIRHILIPAMRRETSSLSAERRPKTSKTEVRKPQGIVKINENGKMYAMNLSTASMGKSLSTNNLNTSLKRLPNTKTRLSTATPMRVADKIWRPT